MEIIDNSNIVDNRENQSVTDPYASTAAGDTAADMFIP